MVAYFHDVDSNSTYLGEITALAKWWKREAVATAVVAVNVGSFDRSIVLFY